MLTPVLLRKSVGAGTDIIADNSKVQRNGRRASTPLRTESFRRSLTLNRNRRLTMSAVRSASRSPETRTSSRLLHSTTGQQGGHSTTCPALKSPVMTRPIRLTSVQKHALHSTWRAMKDNSAERIAERIFQKMVQNQPKVKDVFYKAAFLTIFTRHNRITTCRDHARLLVELLDEVLENLDRCGEILKQIQECGMRHAFLRQSGFKPDIWERFGEAAVEVISAQDCVKLSIEAAKAWTILIACITDEMRHGFEKEARKRSYCLERPRSTTD